MRRVPRELRAPGRVVWGRALVVPALLVLAAHAPARAGAEAELPVPALQASEARPGGATTLAAGRRPGLAAAYANLSLRDRFELGVGRAFFRDPWVAAPASTTARDGLGPLFNAHACVSCHPDGGRGALAADGSPSSALLLRLWRRVPQAQRAVPDPTYGDQLQTLAIGLGAAAGVGDRPPREGVATVRWTAVHGELADGTPFELREPTFGVDRLGYGALHEDVRLAPRLAPSLRGAGLLEVVPERQIVARADPDDADGDGVSGRPAWLDDPGGSARLLGRFGWKAVQPTLRRQVAAALRNDVGITSELFPTQPCTETQLACRDAADGGDPPSGHEISPPLLTALVRFSATLALPARVRAADDHVLRGRATFHRIGCAVCHAPSFVTASDAAIPETASQTVYPHSDLLLHDMGPGLADEVGEGAATGAEWRTAPLWGLGDATRDGARTSLLHDGRARTITEAILWHDGEGARARERFVALPREQRDALLAFLASL